MKVHQLKGEAPSQYVAISGTRQLGNGRYKESRRGRFCALQEKGGVDVQKEGKKSPSFWLTSPINTAVQPPEVRWKKRKTGVVKNDKKAIA